VAIHGAPVEYCFPDRVEEAVDVKQQYGEGARFIAGGTDVLLLMEKEGVHPRILIDLTRIPSLHRLEALDGQVTIGAAVTYSRLLAFQPLLTSVPVLARAIRTIGGVQVRNVATMVGNIVNASPAGDTLAPLYVLGVQVHTFGLQGARSFPVEEFVLGVRRTALAPAEVVTHVTIPVPGPTWQGAFDKLGLRRAMAIAVASVAVMLELERGRVGQARFALGAVAPTVIRVPQAEDYLAGRVLDDESIAQVARLAMLEARPIDDVRGSAHYRKEVVGGLTRRALRELRSHIPEQE